MTGPTAAPISSLRELRRVVAADVAAVVKLKGTAPSLAAVVDVLMLPGTWAVILFRLASFFHDVGLRPLSRLFYFANVVVFSADLAPGSRVGPGLAIPHPVFTGWGSGLTMGCNAILTGGVRFGTAAAEDDGRAGQPTIGDDVIFLDGAKVMGGVHVGDRAVIAANALVLKDVPADAIVVGQPARVTKFRWDRRGASGNRLSDANAEVAVADEAT